MLAFSMVVGDLLLDDFLSGSGLEFRGEQKRIGCRSQFTEFAGPLKLPSRQYQ